MSASYGSCKDSLPVLESVDASARLIIDLKALAANYGTLSKATNAGVAGVVKANAYGVPGELIFTHNGPVCRLCENRVTRLCTVMISTAFATGALRPTIS